MQTLIFNTNKKTLQLLSGARGESKIIETFERIKTVKSSNNGTYYEAIQVPIESHLNPIPVLRVPVSNTNMIIENE